MPNLAHIGNHLSHGGEIIEGSDNVNVNGIPVARLGDKASCRIHGIVNISTCSSTVKANGLGVARVGDSLTCGATIIDGSTNTNAG